MAHIEVMTKDMPKAFLVVSYWLGIFVSAVLSRVVAGLAASSPLCQC